MLNRIVDILVSLILIGVAIPFWVLQMVVSAVRGKWWLTSSRRLGLMGGEWSQWEARAVPAHFILNLVESSTSARVLPSCSMF